MVEGFSSQKNYASLKKDNCNINISKMINENKFNIKNMLCTIISDKPIKYQKIQKSESLNKFPIKQFE